HGAAAEIDTIVKTNIYEQRHHNCTCEDRNAQRRELKPHEGNLCDSRNELETTLWNFLRLGFFHPFRNEQTREGQCCKERRANADCNCQSKAVNRARPKKKQDQGCN